MTRFFLKVLMPFLFLGPILGCRSLSCERSETIDLGRNENRFEISFPSDSAAGFYLLRLELMDNEDSRSFEKLNLQAENNLTSEIRIKAVVEDEAFESLFESEVLAIPSEESCRIPLDFSRSDQERNAACIILYIEGKLSDGTLIFENIRNSDK